jgi:hypothetical protein
MTDREKQKALSLYRPTQAEESLEDFGYTVIVFRHQDDWRKIVSGFPGIFGNVQEV